MGCLVLRACLHLVAELRALVRPAVTPQIPAMALAIVEQMQRPSDLPLQRANAVCLRQRDSRRATVLMARMAIQDKVAVVVRDTNATQVVPAAAVDAVVAEVRAAK